MVFYGNSQYVIPIILTLWIFREIGGHLVRFFLRGKNESIATSEIKHIMQHQTSLIEKQTILIESQTKVVELISKSMENINMFVKNTRDLQDMIHDDLNSIKYVLYTKDKERLERVKELTDEEITDFFKPREKNSGS